METAVTTSPVEVGKRAARWHLIFMLLSMDSVDEFWPEMGLPVGPSAALKKCARQYVWRYRRIEADPLLTPDNRLEEYQRLLEEAGEQVVNELGIATAQMIDHWGNGVFQYETDASALGFLWRRLFRRLAGISALGYPLASPGLPGPQLERVKSVIQAHLGHPAELERRIRLAERRVLSLCDEEKLCQPCIREANPMDWVFETIEYVSTRRTWQSILEILSQEELASLESWGKRQAEIMEMPQDLIHLPDESD